MAAQTLNTRESYRLFGQLGLNVVYFVPGYFAENTIGVLLEFAVQLGLLVSPFGEGKTWCRATKTWLRCWWCC